MGGFEPTTFRSESDNTNHCATEAVHRLDMNGIWLAMNSINVKYIFDVHWLNSLGLIEGFCTVCEQPQVDLNPQPFAQKATTLTTAPWRPHT